MTEQSATEADPSGKLTLGKWYPKSGLAFSVWRDKRDNLGTLFVNDQRFASRNKLPNQQLAQIMVDLLDENTERKMLKKFACEEGFKYLRSVADGTLLTTAADGGPESYDARMAEKAEYKVSIWETGTGIALGLWSKSGWNEGIFFLSNRKLQKTSLMSNTKVAALMLKHIKPEALEELEKDWLNEVGLDALKTYARGEKPKYLRMHRRQPGEHMANRYGSPTQKAIDAEVKTAQLLESAERRGVLLALHSLLPYPMFREFGTVDHVAIMDHSVFLINTIHSTRRIAPSAQEKAMDQYGALAPHLEKLLNEMLNPEHHIFVRVALSIWSPSNFTPRSPYSIAGPELIKTLQALDGQYVKHPIDRKAIIKLLADSDTWSGPAVRKELSTLNEQEEDA